jgi:cytochrome c oxidase cbb3-type subunit 4
MIGIVRGVITLALLLLFIGYVAWAWSDRRKQSFDVMARLALDEDDVNQENNASKVEGRRT